MNRNSTGSKRRRLLLIAGIAILTVSCHRTTTSDGETRRRALQALAADQALRPLPLDVRLDHGIARVSGRVGTNDEERRVLSAVSRTAGVVGVINDLTFSEQRIVEHVQEAFASDPLLAHVPVTIVANGGEVVLRSTQTDAEQRRRLVAVASAVDGVSHVVDEMK